MQQYPPQQPAPGTQVPPVGQAPPPVQPQQVTSTSVTTGTAAVSAPMVLYPSQVGLHFLSFINIGTQMTLSIVSLHSNGYILCF